MSKPIRNMRFDNIGAEWTKGVFSTTGARNMCSYTIPEPDVVEKEEGDIEIIVIEAVDWAMYHDQVDGDTEFDVIKGVIAGILVKETDDYIAITQQKFTTGQVRQTISVPKVCIKSQVRYTCGFAWVDG